MISHRRIAWDGFRTLDQPAARVVCENRLTRALFAVAQPLAACCTSAGERRACPAKGGRAATVPHRVRRSYRRLGKAAVHRASSVTAGRDSDLEAFSRNPARGSFRVLPFQVALFTKYAA